MNKTITQIELLPKKEDRRRITLLTILLFLSVKLMLVSWSQEHQADPELEFCGVWQNTDNLIKEIRINSNQHCSIFQYSYKYQFLDDHTLEIYGPQGVPIYTATKLDDDTLLLYNKLIPDLRKIYKRQHDPSLFW